MPQPPKGLVLGEVNPIIGSSGLRTDNHKLESKEPVYIKNTLFGRLFLDEPIKIKRDAFDFKLPHEVDPPEPTYWGLAQLTREVKELKEELEYIKQRQNSRIKIYQIEDLKRYENKR